MPARKWRQSAKALGQPDSISRCVCPQQHERASAEHCQQGQCDGSDWRLFRLKSGDIRHSDRTTACRPPGGLFATRWRATASDGYWPAVEVRLQLDERQESLLSGSRLGGWVWPPPDFQCSVSRNISNQL